MTNEKNPFGGKNPHGMYVPMTDDELEVLARLACEGAFKIVVVGWGYVENFLPGRYDEREWGPASSPKPLVVFGDMRISFYFRLNFAAPEVPQPNWFFDMEVHAKGHVLFRQRMSTEIGGRPIQVVAGSYLDLALDVAVERIDPAIVKEIKPGAIGLTTRHGNMHLDLHQQRLLALLTVGQRDVRLATAKEARDATVHMQEATKK